MREGGRTGGLACGLLVGKGVESGATRRGHPRLSEPRRVTEALMPLRQVLKAVYSHLRNMQYGLAAGGGTSLAAVSPAQTFKGYAESLRP